MADVRLDSSIANCEHAQHRTQMHHERHAHTNKRQIKAEQILIFRRTAVTISIYNTIYDMQVRMGIDDGQSNCRRAATRFDPNSIQIDFGGIELTLRGRFYDELLLFIIMNSFLLGRQHLNSRKNNPKATMLLHNVGLRGRQPPQFTALITIMRLMDCSHKRVKSPIVIGESINTAII